MTTDEIKRKFEVLAKRGGYHVEEWLLPAWNGQGLRCAATMRIKGDTHGLGFKWDGEKLEDLMTRVIALDYSMHQLPALVAKGKSAIWKPSFEPLVRTMQ